MTPFMEKWLQYRDTRQADYAYRCRTRYKAVADRLFAMGLNDSHTVRDVGAGSCQFGLYLRERGWEGDYIPVDAVIDGTDLEKHEARFADFIVCIETVEHLHNPFRLIGSMQRAARIGFVLTTPNPDAVDVLACDPTHVSFIHMVDLWSLGIRTQCHSWFGVESDTLLGWRMCA